MSDSEQVDIPQPPPEATALAERALAKALAAEPAAPSVFVYGQTGPAVAELQALLVAEGRLVDGTFATGIYDKATQRAVEGSGE